jgi:ABC-type branched-subunit amino acid transport system substrate-binding protein
MNMIRKMMAATALLVLSTYGAGADDQPISVGVISVDSGPSLVAEYANGLEAYRDHINQAGGVGGRQLNIVRCDEGGDPQKNAACVRQFLADEKIVAIIGGGGRNGTISVPLVESGAIAMIDTLPASAQQYKSENVLAISGGLPSWFDTAIEWMAKDKGAKKFAIAYVDTSGGQSSAALAKALVERAEGELKVVPFPLQAVDMAPTAYAVMADSPDAILLSAGQTPLAPLLRALEDAGNTAPVFALPNMISAKGLSDAGSASEMLVTAASFPPAAQIEDGADKQMYEVYLGAIDKAGKEPSDASLVGFLAGEVFRVVAEDIGVDKLTRDLVLERIRQPVDNVPLMPEVLKRGSDPLFAAIANPTTFIVGFKDGQTVLAAEGRRTADLTADLMQ